MAKQTINIGASPNDGTGTPLRTAFDYTNQNFTELYTAVGPSGNNIVCPGSATITGDLTVDTSTLKVDSANNRVGVLNTPTVPFEVTGLIAASNGAFQAGAANGIFAALNNDGTNPGLDLRRWTGSGNNHGTAYIATSSAGDALFYTDAQASNTKATSLRMTLNSTGLGVGVGPGYKLDVRTAPATASIEGSRISDATRTIISGQTGATYSYQGIGANQNVIYASGSRFDIVSDTQNLFLRTGTAAYVLLDTSGNVGIGVTPSTTWATNRRGLQIGGVASSVIGFTGTSPSAELYFNSFFNASSQNICVNTGGVGKYDFNVGTVGCHTWSVGTGTAGNAFTFTQAMTLDASGNLLVGATAQVAAEKFQVNQTVTNAWAVTMRSVTRGWINRQSDANGGIAAYFEVGASNTNVGSITTTASATSYTSASDYRLKEAVQPLAGGLARVSALKPSIYKWKVNGSAGEGFLAHELAEVVPFAVTGEKDAVNEDGTVNPQGVDLSKVVPILVAAIQELTARVQTLETR